MEFFIASDGKKLGPYSIYRVTELLRDKELKPTDLGWTKDQEKWLPLEEIPAIEPVIRQMRKAAREAELGPDLTLKDLKSQAKAAKTKKGTVRVGSEVQPFARFWARWMDYMIVFSAIYLYAETPPMPEAVAFSEIFSKQMEWAQSEAGQKLMQMVLIGLFTWQLVEGILIWLFATTPGKALFGIRVTQEDGSKLPILKSMGRSFYVFTAGFGMGVGILPYIGMTFGFFRLMSTGKTPWDQHLKLKTHHAPMGFVRILVAIAAFIALMMALQALKFS